MTSAFGEQFPPDKLLTFRQKRPAYKAHVHGLGRVSRLAQVQRHKRELPFPNRRPVMDAQPRHVTGAGAQVVRIGRAKGE